MGLYFRCWTSFTTSLSALFAEYITLRGYISSNLIVKNKNMIVTYADSWLFNDSLLTADFNAALDDIQF
jgi:hypothetical protein